MNKKWNFLTVVEWSIEKQQHLNILCARCKQTKYKFQNISAHTRKVVQLTILNIRNWKEISDERRKSIFVCTNRGGEIAQKSPIEDSNRKAG